MDIHLDTKRGCYILIEEFRDRFVNSLIHLPCILYWLRTICLFHVPLMAFHLIGIAVVSPTPSKNTTKDLD